jgi:hypothetical protein
MNGKHLLLVYVDFVNPLGNNINNNNNNNNNNKNSMV